MDGHKWPCSCNPDAMIYLENLSIREKARLGAEGTLGGTRSWMKNEDGPLFDIFFTQRWVPTSSSHPLVDRSRVFSR